MKWYKPGNTLKLEKVIHNRTSYFNNNEFQFLNKKQKFSRSIDWNFEKYGKLWNYNLNYFDYLNQKDMDFDRGFELINDFILHSSDNRQGFESYPLSKRVINWIKWIICHELKSKEIDRALFSQCRLLSKNVEYHQMGNHLLENGFALLFGSYYFKDESTYKKAAKILKAQLDEQILEDGAHFELSPMYHQVILFSMLDSINLTKNNGWKDMELNLLLIAKAKKMLGWLNTMSFNMEEIPLLNDSAKRIAPDTAELKRYSENLGIKQDNKNHRLSASGYRKISKSNYEMVIDIGNIGPDYIPGHAHSDTFNFVLWVRKQPLIVDTGVSTYENNQRRILERSTESHNTVKIDDKEQTSMWNSFKVAERAKIVSLNEKEDFVCCTHDGYKKIKAFHSREFKFEEYTIKISDVVESETEHVCFFYLHFYPGIDLNIMDECKIKGDQFSICFESHDHIEMGHYFYAPEFNRLIKASLIKVSFKQNVTLKTCITLVR